MYGGNDQRVNPRGLLGIVNEQRAQPEHSVLVPLKAESWGQMGGGD